MRASRLSLKTGMSDRRALVRNGPVTNPLPREVGAPRDAGRRAELPVAAGAGLVRALWCAGLRALEALRVVVLLRCLSPVRLPPGRGHRCIERNAGCRCAAAAVGATVWRSRASKRVTTYGWARWAEQDEVRAAGLAGPAGVFLGRLREDGGYQRHEGPEHVMALAPTRPGPAGLLRVGPGLRGRLRPARLPDRAVIEPDR